MNFPNIPDCQVDPRYSCVAGLRARGFFTPRKCPGTCRCQSASEELPVALPVAQEAEARRAVAARLERSGSLTPNVAKAAAAIKFADQAVKFPPKDEQ